MTSPSGSKVLAFSILSKISAVISLLFLSFAVLRSTSFYPLTESIWTTFVGVWVSPNVSIEGPSSVTWLLLLSWKLLSSRYNFSGTLKIFCFSPLPFVGLPTFFWEFSFFKARVWLAYTLVIDLKLFHEFTNLEKSSSLLVVCCNCLGKCVLKATEHLSG